MDNGETVRLFGLDFFAGSQKEFVEVLRECLNGNAKETTVVFTPNPEQIVLAHHNSQFAKDLSEATFLIPDGGRLVDFSRLRALFGKGKPLTERVTGTDVVATLLPALKDRRALIIGGRRYEEWIVVGNTKLRSTTGYENVQQSTAAEEKQVAEIIQSYKPEIIFVAFGAPYQEHWVIEHKKLLAENHVKVVMVVGGAFDFLSGKVL